jgi:hypothetical protein
MLSVSANTESIMLTQPKLLPVGPTARRFRVPVRWLKAEAEAGRVPHLKADTVLLFDPEAVERALLERAQAAAVAPEVQG